MEIKKTALFDVHVALNAKMVEFAGFYMPIQYAGILQEHRRVRTTVGLFDVSHMGEFFVSGPNALAFLQRLTINDVAKLAVDQVQYSAMCYEDGGIVDDLLVYRFADHYMMVVNAANIEKDWEWAQRHLMDGVKLENRSDELSLLALQGPCAEAVLQPLTDLPLSEIKYYWMKSGQVAGFPVVVSRTGYTGEPGFELCFDRSYSVQIWQALMESGRKYEIEPIGLGARDTLRLEMKYCLYGNDIDATTNPLEAGLGWITKLDKGDFIGREALLRVREQGLKRKLIGFEVEGRAVPRHGYALYQGDRLLGHVTSGGFSPMLEKGIGMGYVAIDAAAEGTPLEVDVRGRRVPGMVVKTPFYRPKG
ncbi:MAG: glycine cleavage system aminomethyltransferase GcvT [candidate division KSB1 bacterium]|nr:glycine cleavage system aminomethyltransferase GcvT [candidate division KSB1 bacterium]